ncbi:hypothetical protein AX16_003340 [Volvariella volvacea WC 439]|nr:hypothetical protein AX16_003340 [Volvariella volvacea WC 439]
MLPKVATHIIHTTSRAAAAVQNQTYNFRNVLQLQTSGPTNGPTSLSPWNNGTGSSNWSNNGPGPGGAKNTGSRFYSGYTGPLRAVTQANAVTSSDSNAGHSDEADEIPQRRVAFTPKRTRLRSSSLSLNVQDRLERGETLGILKTVQMHARSKHAFAQPPVPSLENAASTPTSTRPRRNSTSSTHSDEVAIDSQSSAPALVRHNSTVAASSHQDGSSVSPPPPPPSASSQTTSVNNTASQDSQSVSKDSEDYLALRAAADTRNPVKVLKAVKEFRKNATQPSVREFNTALSVLLETRQPGDSLQAILETYNDMIRRSLLPNHITYSTLIQAFLARDLEVQQIIQSLEARSKRRPVTGDMEVSTAHSDAQRLEELKAENNFPSAMSLFEALLSMSTPRSIAGIRPNIYNGLLRSAALHGSLSSAIHIFAQLEARRDIKPDTLTYKYLLHAYSTALDMAGAEAVFEDYKQKVAGGLLNWSERFTTQEHRRIVIQLYNQMIDIYFKSGRPEKAVSLLETMIASPVSAEFGPSDVPPPASSTFTSILAGFIESGDLESAQTWFDRLLEQETYLADPYQPLAGGHAMRPDFAAWETMLIGLALEGTPASVDSLNRLFVQLKADQNINARVLDQVVVFQANMRQLKQADDERAAQLLDFLSKEVAYSEIPEAGSIPTVYRKRLEMVRSIRNAYVDRGDIESAINTVRTFIQVNLDERRKLGPSTLDVMQRMALELQAEVYERYLSSHLDWDVCVALNRIADSVRVGLQHQFVPVVLHSYGVARVTDAGHAAIAGMGLRDWEVLLFTALQSDASQQPEGFAFPGLTSLLQDMAQFKVEFDKIQPTVIQGTLRQLVASLGPQETSAFLSSLGPSFASVVGTPAQSSPIFEEVLSEFSAGASPLPSPMLTTASPQRVFVDARRTKMIEEPLAALLKRPSNGKTHRDLVLDAYTRYVSGLDSGKAPAPATIGRLIQALGRLNEMEKLRVVYERAQEVLRSLESRKKLQADSWFIIEDSMVIAMAHSGDIEAAHLHRQRVLENGGSLTADAYGALILTVKDTTDDATNALALFQESQAHGVPPNQYLYNNIISKLSKARKADHALELFNQMKAQNVLPSSITYGAVIGACARVGDVQSAETLFEEMVQAKNFRPRVPPFNTMMQLYTTTKPDRERALFYYEQMLKAHVKPTAHTYKLLMDAYGSIEPVDVPAMEKVFETLQRDPSVEVQGTHYASLINAYGCVQKDFDKAVAIFNSIYRAPGNETSSTPSSPATEASLSSFSSSPVTVASNPHTPAPDAVVFEAIINVLVTHRRTDLLPEYINKMNASGVHMTAYIANFLIKGYAVVGELDRARDIFESLVDPPVGVAAPNNHAPHDPSASSTVDPMAPVYREPSTWEAMVRAELGAGNRAQALDLLERLKARKYPEAVYNRISGIMVDRSMISS